MNASGGPPGQGGTKEERKRSSVLEELSFLIFQCGLAHRRVQDIMDSGDLAIVIWYRELTFVHKVLSDVDSLLRSVMRNATQDNDSDVQDRAREQAQVHLGEGESDR